MSNIDKRALREAAEKALNARTRLALMQSVFNDDGDDVKPEAQEDINICVFFNDLTNPATVLALLDELEASEKRNAVLIEFLAHIKKCLVKNREYAPLSHEEIDTLLGIRADGKGAAQ
ncbi:ead/Ea22-like family protein [Enterobacter roggenkampii]|uniref:ead/Ea22-like family protein n=1 Tax=Enterobacter roggenkampii TaxID=1812935 RepID=UPI001C9AFE96|nr:ead/Ea22-like family protein [Enterobacter roggenkampii]MBY7252010.1 ead/Ea22-like family protein [Enterobacter roggenkampii]